MTIENRLQQAVPATSPCIGMCKLNTEAVCLGCQRTLNQIQAWPTMTEQQRIEATQACLRLLQSATDN
ncbi:DUF1289 domain-containing protein [Salinimonas marina]|uniref:DUF1289 domain-containing protein n=1 Tax=Salinimonas marina TaxID=2785918 RepID=A0A7S9HCQ6_9ALTE|nr:DUF1289 domain-containing protein [Salinimonas marina]QPG04726.1 DUF1289 domain-containing protein [Salinimonas marina]